MSANTIFLKEALTNLPNLISHQDRLFSSPTYGCFDSLYWRWRQKDLPNASVQYAVYPLALAWSLNAENNPYYQNAQVNTWIQAGMSYWQSLQHANGSFDQSFPFEQSVGTTCYTLLAMLNTLHLLQEALPEDFRASIMLSIRKAAHFVLTHDETYGMISNHAALFACCFYELYRVLGEPAYEAKAARLIQAIKAQQSSEGWFMEYEGPDPGYQTQCLYYLAYYYRLSGAVEILAMVQQAIRGFSIYFFHPDGTLGGEYGARNTELYYPAGFEMLAPEIPEARAIASAMRRAIAQGLTVSLNALDLENLARVMANYLNACRESEIPETQPVSPLPYQQASVEKFFPHAGLLVKGNPCYYAIISGNKGGVVKIFDKPAQKLIWARYGYVGQTAGGEWITTQLYQPAAGQFANDVFECNADFFHMTREIMTPLRFVGIRLLSLTLFRNFAVNEWFKKFLVKVLFTAKRKYPLTVSSKMYFWPETVEIQDTLICQQPIRLDWLASGKRFTGIQMASAGYFQAQQLQTLPDSLTPLNIAQLHTEGKIVIHASIRC